MKKIFWFGLVLCMFLSGCSVEAFMGVDATWVISADYTTITHGEDVYVSIDEFATILDSYERELLVQEAKVENNPSIVVLFFGNQIYSVLCNDFPDIIYLYTDYDGDHPSYFCKESMYDDYIEKLSSIPK